MIRAVVFDFGNVISAFDYGSFFRAIGQGGRASPAEMMEAIVASGIHRDYERGAISSDRFFAAAAELLGVTVGKEAFFEAFSGIFTPIETTSALIRSLKGDYRIGLLSNTNEWHYEHTIRAVPVFGLFDAVTLSFEVGALKPAEAIYRDVLRKLGLPPRECAYIDDIEEYARGAERAGMAGIRYESHAQLLRDLSARGVRAG